MGWRSRKTLKSVVSVSPVSSPSGEPDAVDAGPRTRFLGRFPRHPFPVRGCHRRPTAGRLRIGSECALSNCIQCAKRVGGTVEASLGPGNRLAERRSRTYRLSEIFNKSGILRLQCRRRSCKILSYPGARDGLPDELHRPVAKTSPTRSVLRLKRSSGAPNSTKRFSIRASQTEREMSMGSEQGNGQRKSWLYSASLC
jgi:hypothetical protein